ncbi:hypothetical protein P2P98_16220 [Microbacterium sp. Kw_RZR3]|uniref:hypothetical protein n=1 Tax=Microbacterium sp. Kw_RZR3 TaxID=3032903 RepID=UPI0023DC17A0|nr:hypothetical protein [Microbacterium sp. Kw_RZR3]MDF2047709.1 hypothetical protein [Microbacterium sp. Kw_RZR3]
MFWFRTLLHTAGRLVATYPGTAKWMLMHGPTVTAALPILEAGIAVLRESGFGARTSFAYAALFNNAMLTVSLNDDRLQHEGDGPRDHATMMEEFRRMPTASPHAHDLGREIIGPFAEGGQTAVQTRWAYYDFVVDTTIAGLDASLRPTAG